METGNRTELSHKIMDSLDNERFDEAEELISRGLSDNPKDLFLQYLEGMAARKAGKFEKARGIYLKKLVSDPNDPIINSELGIVLAKLGEYEECIEQVNRTERLEKTIVTPEAYQARVWSYFQTQQYQQALYHIDQILEQNDAYGYRIRGMCQYHLGNKVDAYNSLCHAIMVDDNDAESVIELVKIVLETKDFDRILVFFEKLLEHHQPASAPWNSKIPYAVLLAFKLQDRDRLVRYLNLIDLHISKNKNIPSIAFVSYVIAKASFLNEAVELLDFSFDQYHDPLFLKTKYRLLADNNEYLAAVDTIETLQQMVPDYEPISMVINKAYLLLDSNNALKALETIEALLVGDLRLDDEARLQALFIKTDALRALARYEEALNIFDLLAQEFPHAQLPTRLETLMDVGRVEDARVLLRDPNIPLTEEDRYLIMARLLVEMEEFSKAKEMLTKMNEMIPRRPYILHQLAIVLSKETEFIDIELAIQYLDEAISVTQTSDLYLTKAAIYAKVGNKKDQLLSLQKALSINPTNINAMMEYGLLHMGYQDYSQAQKLFLQITMLNDTLEDAWFALCQTHYFSNEAGSDVLDRIDHTLSLVSDGTRKALLHVMKANAFFENNELERAILSADEAIKEGTDDEIVYYIKSAIELRNHEYQKGYQTIETIFAKKTLEEVQTSPYLIHFVSALFFVGNYERAMEMLLLVPDKDQDSYFFQVKEKIEDALEKNEELT